MTIIRSFHLGDRLISLLAELYTGENPPQPITLGAEETVVFRMVSRAAVKVDNKPATVVSRGGAGLPAQVRYDWDAEDVADAGVFSAWFIRNLSGETEHFPTESPSVGKLTIIIKADN